VTLLRRTDRGLYCEAGDFYVDPWASVERAVVTHAHGDHVAWGCRAYLTSAAGLLVLRQRLDPSARNPRGRLWRRGRRERGPHLPAPGGTHPGFRPGAGRAPVRGVGSCRATTRPSRTRPARRGSRSYATRSWPSAPSGCRRIAG